jgi:hypothetical protein
MSHNIFRPGCDVAITMVNALAGVSPDAEEEKRGH